MAEDQITEQSRPYLLYAQVEALIREEIKREGLKPGARLPTEAELCQRFDVSRSTIRQALNRLEVAGLITRTRGKGTFVRQAAVQEVHDAALVTRKEVAPELATHKFIGLVFCARSDTLQMNILLGAERAAKSRGYAVMFGYSGEDSRTETQEIERLLRIGAAGVIVMPISNVTATPGVQMVLDHQLPLVLVDRYLSDFDTSYVVSNGFDGMYRVTEHLLILGYESFTFTTSGLEGLMTTSVRDRYRGFCQALEDYGRASAISPPVAVDAEDRDAVAQFFANHATKTARPLAVVALHDAIAINLTRTAASLGLTPPDDFAVVGFDDLPMAGHMPVPLTTVAQPRYDMGFKSGHLLIDKIEGRVAMDEKLVLPVSLVVRESCGSRRIVLARQNATAQASFFTVSG
jgi:DNA-binding LacI/PurR family transcriptional regulator